LTNRTLLIGVGYIGSRLLPELEGEVETIDAGWFSPADSQDMDLLTIPYIRSFKDVILLAGHSSVGMCKGDFCSAYKNNVSNFITLLSKMSPRQRLIYASSASVYGNVEDAREEFPLAHPLNEYDSTKQAIDNLARTSEVPCIGLRFGTVCGASPIMRTELILNSMTLSARNTGFINLSSAESNRAVLWIGDLVRAVTTIQRSDVSRGVFNLSSFNSSIGNLASQIELLSNSTIKESGGSTPYSFSMDCSLFEKTFNFTFEGNCRKIYDEVSSLSISEEERGSLTRNHHRSYKVYG
jgi:nucleoside-diphosphate-sugar epimerase